MAFSAHPSWGGYHQRWYQVVMNFLISMCHKPCWNPKLLKFLFTYCNLRHFPLPSRIYFRWQLCMRYNPAHLSLQADILWFHFCVRSPYLQLIWLKVYKVESKPTTPGKPTKFSGKFAAKRTTSIPTSFDQLVRMHFAVRPQTPFSSILTSYFLMHSWTAGKWTLV